MTEVLGDVENLEYVETNQLTAKQYDKFLEQVEQVPAKRSPISGQVCRLGFEFMEDTGLRITEMLHVKKSDIDFDTRILIVTHPKTQRKCKCSKWRYKDLYTRTKILESVDINCKICLGKGTWKKPQRATITPRLIFDLERYCELLNDNDLLWPASRQSFWNWGKMAGVNAEIKIFQQKDEKLVKGVFNHLFRQLCSKRMTVDAKDDKFQNQLVDIKMRHSIDLRSTYNRPDINYLLAWEHRKYTILIP